MKKNLLLLGLFPLLGFGLVAAEASSVAMPKSSSLGAYVNKLILEDGQAAHIAAAEELNIEIADESMVLLKNEGNYLPLAKYTATTSSGRTTYSGVEKVTVFGANSLKMLTGGGGSGASSTSSGFMGVDFYQALEAADFVVNPTMKAFYTYANGTGFNTDVPVWNNTAWGPTGATTNKKIKSGMVNSTNYEAVNDVTIGEAPLAWYDEYANDADATHEDPWASIQDGATGNTYQAGAAIFFIARAGTEGFDVRCIDNRDFWFDEMNDRHGLELTVNEEALLDKVETYFSKIIVCINAGTAFECDRFDTDDKIKAVIWMGTPGNNGSLGVGHILRGYRYASYTKTGNVVTGSGASIPVSPAGKTIDTWYRDFKKDPTYQNFSLNDQTNPGYNSSNEFEGYYPNITMFDKNGEPIRSLGSFMPTVTEGDVWVEKYGVKTGTYGGAEIEKGKGWNWDDGKRQSGNNQNGSGWLPYPNYADHKVVEGGLNGCRPSQYVSYEEGIYVDYRYYETRWAEMNAADKEGKEGEKAGDRWYAGAEGVIYPFGYGLSFTSFSQKIIDCSVAGKEIGFDDDTITVDVKVTNTGSKAGKEAVQLYWKAPYTAGGIEKAYEVLCAVDKTKTLEAGESQVIRLSFHPQDVANYDFSDANKNGFFGYELDGGDYSLSVNKNAHEVYDSVDFKVRASGIKYKNDRITGYEVTNQFTGKGFFDSLPGEKDIGFQQMTRADMSKNTFSDYVAKLHPTMDERKVKDGSRVQEFFDYNFHIWDFEAKKAFDYMPEEVYKTKEDIEKLGWTQLPVPDATKGETLPTTAEIQLSEMTGVYDLKDPRWDTILNGLTYNELQDLVDGGNPHNPAITRIGKPSPSDNDGPNQFKAGATMFWCGEPLIAASFSPDIAKAQGDIIGWELQNASNYGGWCGPACNLHRSPFGGRNFEYYSSDPILAGIMCARVCAGATEAGMYCYFKHFAANDQEDGREGVISYLTEQAYRELYLKPFQMGIQYGKAMGIMSSYNRVGLMETAANYNLLTNVLRREWGFNGAIFSDMTHHSNSRFHHDWYENINNRVLAGDTNQLDGSTFAGEVDCKWDNEVGAPVYAHGDDEGVSYSWWYAVREMAKEQLYICANCRMMDNKQVREANLASVDGLVRNCIDLKVGKPVDLEVNVDAYAKGNNFRGNTIYSVSVREDEQNPLPYGLELVNGYIVGTPTQAFNTFSHILIDLSFITDYDTIETVTIGLRIEFTVTADNVDPDYKPAPTPPSTDPSGDEPGSDVPTPDSPSSDTPEPEKGCGGAIIGASLLAFTLATAGAVLFLKKKED